MLVVVLSHAMQTFLFVSRDYPKLANSFVLNLDSPYRWMYAVIFYSVSVGVVSVFFLFSGYLHYVRQRAYVETLKRRLPGLLVPMALWTVVFSVITLALIPHAGLSSRYDFLFTADPGVWFARLVGDYSRPFDPGLCLPTVYQFWYLRDLAVLVLIGPIIGWGLRRAPVVFLVLVTACAFSGWRPLVVSQTAIMFYTLGAFCGTRKATSSRLPTGTARGRWLRRGWSSRSSSCGRARSAGLIRWSRASSRFSSS